MVSETRETPTPQEMMQNFNTRRALFGTALILESATFGFIALALQYYYRNLSHKTYRKWIHLGNTFAGGVFLSIALLYALPSHQKRLFPAAHTTVLLAYTTFLVIDKALRPAMVTAVSKSSACRHEQLDVPEVWDLRSTQTSDADDPLATQVVERSDMWSAKFIRCLIETTMLGCYSFVVSATASNRGEVRGLIVLLSLHWLIAMAIGMRYAAMELDSCAYCVLVLVHSMIAPMGMVVGGVLVGEIRELAFDMGSIVSAAIMLYIGGFEMAYEQFVSHGRWLLCKSFAVSFGTWIVVGVTGILVCTGVY